MAAPAAALTFLRRAAAGADDARAIAVAACLSASAAAKAAALMAAERPTNAKPPAPPPPPRARPPPAAPDRDEARLCPFPPRPAARLRKRTGGTPALPTPPPCKSQSRAYAPVRTAGAEGFNAAGNAPKGVSADQNVSDFLAFADETRAEDDALRKPTGSLEAPASRGNAALPAFTAKRRRRGKRRSKNDASRPPVPAPADDARAVWNVDAVTGLAAFAEAHQKAGASLGGPVVTLKDTPAGSLHGARSDVGAKEITREASGFPRIKETSSRKAKAQGGHGAKPTAERRVAVADSGWNKVPAGGEMSNGTSVGFVAEKGVVAEISCHAKPTTQHQYGPLVPPTISSGCGPAAWTISKETSAGSVALKGALEENPCRAKAAMQHQYGPIVPPTVPSDRSEALPRPTASWLVDPAQTVPGAPADPRYVCDREPHGRLPKLHPSPAHADELASQTSRKLSQKLHELVESMAPTTDDFRRLEQFKAKVDAALLRGLGPNFQARIFGSAATDLWLGSNSDVDLCLVPVGTGLRGREPNIFEVRNSLARGAFQITGTISGCSVPIVKFTDPDTDISSDVNVNNVLGIQNTELIQTYINFDARVKPLLSLVKLFAKRRKINDPVTEVTPSSYCHVMMTLNYLQTRARPILPSLQDCPDSRRVMVELTKGDRRMAMKRTKSRNSTVAVGKFVDGTFARDFTQVQFQALLAPCEGQTEMENIADLLFGFFRHYGHAFDFAQEAVSVRLGRRAYKEELEFHRDVIAVEDPFLLWKNLTYTSRPATLSLLLSEYRRAADILAGCTDVDAAVASIFEPRVRPSKQGQMSEATGAAALRMRNRKNPAATNGHAGKAANEMRRGVDDARQAKSRRSPSAGTDGVTKRRGRKRAKTSAASNIKNGEAQATACD